MIIGAAVRQWGEAYITEPGFWKQFIEKRLRYQ
jgi:hypothetical protein